MLDKFPEVTQLESGKVGIWTLVSWGSLCFSVYHTAYLLITEWIFTAYLLCFMCRYSGHWLHDVRIRCYFTVFMKSFHPSIYQVAEHSIEFLVGLVLCRQCTEITLLPSGEEQKGETVVQWGPELNPWNREDYVDSMEMATIGLNL